MLSRRDFLNTTLGTGLMMATQGTQEAAAQGAAASRRIIVDSQVHLWRAQAPDRPWPPDGAGACASSAPVQL